MLNMFKNSFIDNVALHYALTYRLVVPESENKFSKLKIAGI